MGSMEVFSAEKLSTNRGKSGKCRSACQGRSTGSGSPGHWKKSLSDFRTMFYIHWAICFPGFVEDGVGRPGAGAPISQISGIVGQTGPFKARRALGTPGLDFCGASSRGRRAARWMGSYS